MSDFKKNLVESADAAARVGMLFVTVALFAAMWESDSPPTAQADHWLAGRAGIAEPLTQTEGSVSRTDSDDHTRTGQHRSGAVDSVSITHNEAQPYPLPSGIVPGHYRVVDSLGKVGSLLVTEDMATRDQASSDREQFVVEDGRRTVYFIRLHGPVTAELNSLIYR